VAVDKRNIVRIFQGQGRGEEGGGEERGAINRRQKKEGDRLGHPEKKKNQEEKREIKARQHLSVNKRGRKLSDLVKEDTLLDLGGGENAERYNQKGEYEVITSFT